MAIEPISFTALMTSVVTILGICCKEMHKSKCTQIDCCCLHLKRNVEENEIKE